MGTMRTAFNGAFKTSFHFRSASKNVSRQPGNPLLSRCRETNRLQPARPRLRPTRVGVEHADLAVAVAEPLIPLGYDFLKFLAACVVVTPICKRLNISSILGYLLAGVLLREFNGIADVHDLSELAELGVLFLLFEMGLELSSSRLQALSKYAFGLGTIQVFVTTAVFVGFAVPFGSGLGTILLERLASADAAIATVHDWDEAIVLGVALSLSSSAFVLQILGEKGELATRAGSATLGILLLQDLITVPFLVLLPLLVSSPDAGAAGAAAATSFHPIGLIEQFFPTVARTLGFLGVLVLFGRFGLRRVFELVAGTSSNDAFVALSLLCVCGTAIATDALGFGQTLGAFLAGVLLAETSFRSQIEAEIKPFRGLLLGLFFLCTGASVDVDVLVTRFPIIALLTVGLIGVKSAITTTAARGFGLSKAEAFKVGLTLSQGGEFAFVLLALARDLQVLPAELNQILIIVVVFSMALTPVLYEVADKMERNDVEKSQMDAGESLSYELSADPCDTPPKSPIVLLGFNQASQMVANMIQSPLVGANLPWVAFEYNPARIRAAREAGLPVLYGDGSRSDVLHSTGVESPQAFVLGMTSHVQAIVALNKIQVDFPNVPVFALCRDMKRASEMRARGARVVVGSAAGGIALGDLVLRGLGSPVIGLALLEREMQRAVNAEVAPGGRLVTQELDPEVFVFDPAQAIARKDGPSRSRANAPYSTKLPSADEARLMSADVVASKIHVTRDGMVYLDSDTEDSELEALDPPARGAESPSSATAAESGGNGARAEAARPQGSGGAADASAEGDERVKGAAGDESLDEDWEDVSTAGAVEQAAGSGGTFFGFKWRQGAESGSSSEDDEMDSEEEEEELRNQRAWEQINMKK